MYNEKKFIENLTREFNETEGGGEGFTNPPSFYADKLRHAAEVIPYVTDVQLDTAVFTFWCGHLLKLSITVINWPDAALSELFDLVYPKLYDNRDMDSPVNTMVWQ